MTLVRFKGDWGVWASFEVPLVIWRLQFKFRHELFPDFKNVQHLFNWYLFWKMWLHSLGKMSDTLRSHDIKVAVLTAGRLGRGSHDASAHGAFSPSSPPNRGDAVGNDLRHRNTHWSFIIWSCDGERMLQIQKKPLNLRELGGFTKWWKKKGPKRKKINRITVGILMNVLILAGGKEDVENALITIFPSLESLEGHDRWGFLQRDHQPADKGALITWNLSRDTHLPSHCPAKTVKCVNWPPGSWPVVLEQEDRSC